MQTAKVNPSLNQKLSDRKAVDIFYLGFSQDFETLFHKFFIEKLFIFGLQEQTGR